MKFLNLDSISKKLTLLVIFAILPALVILLYTGIEHRRQSFENAKQAVLLLTHTMAEAQKEITNSSRQLLSTLSLLPAIQALNLQTSTKIFEAVLEQNSNYNNILLVDLTGEVLVSGRTFPKINLAYRKHIREAIDGKDFAVGEYIVSKSVAADPLLAFAYPVFDNKGNLKAILTTSIKLTSFAYFHDFSTLPAKSFVAVTDHQGIRLFYYPAQETTNPVGKAIKAKSWQVASSAKESKIFTSTGSDGLRRIFAFVQVRLTPKDDPYLYVWAGIPEDHILASANAILTRNLLLVFLAAVISLFFSWVIGKNTLLAPIQSLVSLTRKFAQEDLTARSESIATPNELGTLTRAFHDMADTLAINQRTLRENEARFRLIMDSLDELVYVADMDTYEILFINEYAKNQFGDIVGRICWQSLQKGQKGPCDFCTNKYLLNESGNPGEVYIWESQHTITGKWLHIIDRAIIWSDGRVVRLEVATDISDLKKADLVKEALIEKLEKALKEIKTLRGILPICSFCKNIRNDEGYYEKIEGYIHKHSGVDFSHTICPKCAKENYPEEYEKIISKNSK